MKEQRFAILHILLLLIICYFSFFYRLGVRGLTDPDEGRYAESAREMLAKGDLITPWLNDQPRLQKPILIYWLIIASYKIVGINEFGARLPSAVAATGTVLVLYFLCRALFAPLIALLAGIILALSPLPIALARISNADMVLTFFIVSALAAFATFYFRNHRFYLLLFYLSLAFGTLTKGYVGFFIPWLIIFFFLASLRELKFFRQLYFLQGLLIILLLNLPWYLLVGIIHKDLLRYYLIEEGVLRFFTAHHQRQQPVFYYVVLIFPAFFPWSLFFINAFFKQVKGGLKNFARSSPEQFFFFIWYIVGLGTFSLSGSKLPTYIMPIFPALSVSAALWCTTNFFTPVTEKFSRYISSPKEVKLALLLIIIAGVGLIGACIGADKKYSPYIFQATIGASIFTLTGVKAHILRQRTPSFSLSALVFGSLMLVIFILPSIDGILSQRRSAKNLCEKLYSQLKETDKIYFVERSPLPSALFYLRRPLQRIAKEDEAKRILQREKNIFLFVDDDDLEEFIDDVDGLRIVAKGEKFYIITNKK